MTLLILGLALFFFAHFITSSPALSEKCTSIAGEKGPTRILSILSAIGLVMIIAGFVITRTDQIIIYDPPHWLRHVSWLLMLISLVILVSSKLNGYIRQKLKHPMTIAIKVWAFAHLLVNGDLASAILFGSFLAWAVYLMMAYKKRLAAGGELPSYSPNWQHDVIALLIGVALYGVLVLFAHEWLIGVPVR